jgi:DNA-binding MarR family transcriptional regulator
MEDKNIDIIINLYFKSLEMFKSLESTPRDFGSGELLYSSEVHTLVAIGKNSGLNLTDISVAMNVSKSAVSKFVKKLLNKGLIQKRNEEKNKKEVVFYLTLKGQTVFAGHEIYEQNTFAGIFKILAGLSSAEKAFLTHFLQGMIDGIKISSENE